MYKTLIGLIFIYAIAHLLYPVFDRSELTSPEEIMWFLSGGLAVLFNGSINLINQSLQLPFTRFASIVTNAIMFAFLAALCVVIQEIQVYVLALILLVTLIFSYNFKKSA